MLEERVVIFHKRSHTAHTNVDVNFLSKQNKKQRCSQSNGSRSAKFHVLFSLFNQSHSFKTQKEMLKITELIYF
jgi:hypothetical protein